MHSNINEVAALRRTCEAVEIPSGNKINLYEGTEVIITQTLGGNYTVVTHQGLMASIANKDADALGKEVIKVPEPKAGESPKSIEEQVWDQMRTCYDPEIPHNIVDLGLVYECIISELEDNTHRVDIKMTLTAPGCGMGDFIKEDVRQKVLKVPGIKEADVKVVFDPPWDRSRIHKALRRELNMD